MAEPKGFKSLNGQTLNDATSGMTQQQFEKTVSGLQKIGEPVNLRQVESIWNKRYKKQQPQSSTSKFIMKILNFGNTKKTGEIKKNYGGSMKKMNIGSKVGTTKKSYGGTIKKMRSGSKVGMTQQQMMACGRKK